MTALQWLRMPPDLSDGARLSVIVCDSAGEATTRRNPAIQMYMNKGMMTQTYPDFLGFRI
jgi:hypothetical protein